jgi:hypothetical protein
MGTAARSSPNVSHVALSFAVLQKDGNYDIEKNVNNGDEGDFWVLNDELGPGPNTWPNTDAYQGTQTQTGLKIKITTAPSLVTQFQVSGYKKWPGGSGMAPGFDSGTGTTGQQDGGTGTISDAIGTPAQSTGSSAKLSSSSSSPSSDASRNVPAWGRLVSALLAVAAATATTQFLLG